MLWEGRYYLILLFGMRDVASTPQPTAHGSQVKCQLPVETSASHCWHTSHDFGCMWFKVAPMVVFDFFIAIDNPWGHYPSFMAHYLLNHQRWWLSFCAVLHPHLHLSCTFSHSHAFSGPMLSVGRKLLEQTRKIGCQLSALVSRGFKHLVPFRRA